MRYALVREGSVIRTSEFIDHPPQLHADKGMEWLPLRQGACPEYDPALEACESMTMSVGAGEVVEEFVITQRDLLGECHARRRAAYPPLEKQLELLGEGLVAALAGGEDLPASWRALVEMIAQVKAAYPKPVSSETGNG